MLASLAPSCQAAGLFDINPEVIDRAWHRTRDQELFQWPKTRPNSRTLPLRATLPHEATINRRADCNKLIALLKKITHKSPKMWGPSIVGFGSYRYTYKSGHSGVAPLTGFAIRGRELVIYLVPPDKQRSLLSKLGRHKMDKSCLYFRRLADLDRSVLKRLVAGSVGEARRRYGQDGNA